MRPLFQHPEEKKVSRRAAFSADARDELGHLVLELEGLARHHHQFLVEDRQGNAERGVSSHWTET